MFRFAFGKLGGLLEFQTAFFAVASKQPEHRFWMRGKIGQRVLCQKGGSWPRFVKRGGLEVLPYFPAHGREGEAAPLLRRNLLILLVQVAILMASRTLAKNQPSWQSTKIYRNKNFDASITQDDEILFVGIRLPAFASIRGL